MKNLNSKKILLIICGGIAAYKSLEVIRLLKKKGSSVKTILTNNAKNFVTPLSVASLSQEKVYTDLFNSDNESEMDHISLSRWSDLILIAPATANTISKISFGLSDDLASTVVFASDKKIFIAPAMNVRMWEHQSNKDNLKKLTDFGHEIIGPEIGEMACGEYGMGKMSEPETIINHISNYFKKLESNKKFKALVTAGPTQEYIDPVRFISNKSSGKQGYEIARSLVENGFDTTLISGPTNLNPIKGTNLIKVKSADEMLEATLNNLPTDIAIFSAAVLTAARECLPVSFISGSSTMRVLPSCRRKWPRGGSTAPPPPPHSAAAAAGFFAGTCRLEYAYAPESPHDPCALPTRTGAPARPRSAR